MQELSGPQQAMTKLNLQLNVICPLPVANPSQPPEAVNVSVYVPAESVPEGFVAPLTATPLESLMLINTS